MAIRMLVEDKVSVITGAASGIGEATAKLYSEHGAKVVVADVDDEGGNGTVEDIVADGGEATFVRTDVSDSSDVQNMIETAVAEYGGLDVLFNNAGIEGPHQKIGEFDEEGLDRVIDINLKGVFYGIKYGVQAMQADGGGSIISTSSIGAERGVLGRSAYGASKEGVNGMSRCAAIEYAQDDIRVNTIEPGIIETPMHDRSAEQKPDETYEIWEPLPPGNGQPIDIANAALFLGSDMAARISGHKLPVDGGYLAEP